jgi:hypothetical protein
METKGCPVESVLGIRADGRGNADVVIEMQSFDAILESRGWSAKMYNMLRCAAHVLQSTLAFGSDDHDILCELMLP